LLVFLLFRRKSQRLHTMCTPTRLAFDDLCC